MFAVGDVVRKIKPGILDIVVEGDECIVVGVDNQDKSLFDIRVRRISDGEFDWQRASQFELVCSDIDTMELDNFIENQ